MKFYNFPWGLYPRRIQVYLAEKGINDIDVEDIELHKIADWPPPWMLDLNPAGTLPVLEGQDGTLIRQSLAIIDYLEDLYPQPNLMGETPVERAATREMMAIIDDATTFFGIWCHLGSPIFEGTEAQSLDAAQAGARRYHKKLQVLEAMIKDGPFLQGDRITVADCLAIALSQFVNELYDVPIPHDCQKLKRWFESFSQRPSVPRHSYPSELRDLARGLPTVTGVEWALNRQQA